MSAVVFTGLLFLLFIPRVGPALLVSLFALLGVAQVLHGEVVAGVTNLVVAAILITYAALLNYWFVLHPGSRRRRPVR